MVKKRASKYAPPRPNLHRQESRADISEVDVTRRVVATSSLSDALIAQDVHQKIRR